MSETLGRTVLRQAAQYFRDNPNVWTLGCGSLNDLARGKSNAKVKSALNLAMDTGCIVTILRAHAFVVAGRAGKEAAFKEAVRILCEFHRIEVAEKSIGIFNDIYCGSAEKAALFIEQAIEGKYLCERKRAKLAA
jgi:hypothetical protein